MYSIFVTILCVALVGIIIFAYRYIQYLISNTYFLKDHITEIANMTQEYTDHLELVYNMDSYYGDSVLENLLKHTKFVSESIKNMKIDQLFEEEELDELSEKEE